MQSYMEYNIIITLHLNKKKRVSLRECNVQSIACDRIYVEESRYMLNYMTYWFVFIIVDIAL